MKKLTVLFILSIFCFPNFLQTQEEEETESTGVELYVRNYYNNSSIFVRFYPVSAVFNGHTINQSISKLSLNSVFDLLPRIGPPTDPTLDYLVGLDGWALNNRGSQNGYFELTTSGLFNTLYLDQNHSGSERADGLFGYGIYNLEFYYYDGNMWLVTDPIVIDCSDLNYSYALPMAPDLFIDIYDPGITPPCDIRFHWAWGGLESETRTDEMSIYDTRMAPGDRGVLRYYKQYHLVGSTLNVYEKTPNQNPYRFGVLDDSDPDYLLLPLKGNNSTIVPSPYTIPNHPNPGLLVSNLDLDNNQVAKVKCGESFTVSNNSTLRLKNGGGQAHDTKFIVGDDPNGNCYSSFTLSTLCTLELYLLTQFIVERSCQLTLQCNSFVKGSGSRIILKDGSRFCNRGAIISGSRIVIPPNSIIRPGCLGPNPCLDNFMKDSAILLIEEGSELEIPDSTTYVFEGTETALICKDSSTIKFGKGSKLVFKDGARISANNTKFMSMDSSDTWDGIYIKGVIQDTLSNCTFENARNGINIGDPLALTEGFTTTMITNCTFSNKTASALVNQVYVYGNNLTLISGCNTVSSISEGFTSAVMLEYSGSGYVVICDNNFSNVSGGIVAIQSSPYIARNVITGPSGNGTGISLDNSNGTIEYNKIYNFEQSIYCLYSSPYLLKNTLSDASEMNLLLNSNSAPVLKPVTSGPITRWLGGNNTFTGTPNQSAFNFSDDCAPLMDSGYNVISITGSYYMSAELSGDFYATLNNWYDDPPDPDLFETSGGRIVYEPYFDGSSLPSTDYFELNSLGFDLYDSVYVKDLTETSTVDSYFMQAYMMEMEVEYSDAIIKYKYVVSDFKTTSYAPVALARIFACLEKANSTIGAFQQIQGYYAGINSDTGNTITVRELAEDFMIKSKVKQGMIEEAISDYEAIYQANTGNSTGIHALINKTCLERMLSYGDNMSSNTSGYSEHKAKLLSLLLGKEIKNNHISINNTIPGNFRLYQNYPNPFNPVTSIKYDIPKDNFVNIRIYDLLGREVFSSGEFKKTGSYEVKFDGTNFASGLYFYSLETGSFRETKKMVLVK